MCRLCVFCLFCVFVCGFCGCSTIGDFWDKNANNAENTPVINDETTSAQAVSVGENVKNVFYSLNSYSLKRYEPAYGCYLGAYILADRSVGYDMTMFEMKTLPHASYKYHMKLGEQFPLSWVLSCYKEERLPFVVISPNENMMYDYEQITECAKNFGYLNVPMLVGFYPDPVKNGCDPEMYKKFFCYAREEFRRYAPNTAFVFIEDVKNADKSDKFFPGDEYVDWVGIDVYMEIKNDSIDNSGLADINYIYNKYQSKYPIMLSSLGISNYTSLDHKYYTNRAAQEIKNVYAALKDRYPRIKAVYYMDFDSNDVSVQKNDSFLITASDQVTQGYKQAARDSYFLYKTRNSEDSVPQKISLCRVALQINKNLYIPYETVENFGLKCEKTPKVVFNEGTYADVFSLARENGFSVGFDETGALISG